MRARGACGPGEPVGPVGEACRVRARWARWAHCERSLLGFQHIRQIQCTTPCPTNRSLAWAPISLHDATTRLPVMTLWRGLAQKLAHRCSGFPCLQVQHLDEKTSATSHKRARICSKQIAPLAHAMPTCLDRCFDSFEEHLTPSKRNKTPIFLQ